MRVEIWRIVLDVFGYQSWFFSSSGFRWRTCILESPVSQLCLICLCAPRGEGDFFAASQSYVPLSLVLMDFSLPPSASRIWIFWGGVVVVVARQCELLHHIPQMGRGNPGLEAPCAALERKGSPGKKEIRGK